MSSHPQAVFCLRKGYVRMPAPANIGFQNTRKYEPLDNEAPGEDCPHWGFFCCFNPGENTAMGKPLEPGAAYSGRRADAAVINCTVDKEVATLMRHYGPGKKLGWFMSRLVHEHHAKQQERQRVQQAVHNALEEATTG
jgi:hypothetical protein